MARHALFRRANPGNSVFDEGTMALPALHRSVPLVRELLRLLVESGHDFVCGRPVTALAIKPVQRPGMGFVAVRALEENLGIESMKNRFRPGTEMAARRSAGVAPPLGRLFRMRVVTLAAGKAMGIVREFILGQTPHHLLADGTAQGSRIQQAIRLRGEQAVGPPSFRHREQGERQDQDYERYPNTPPARGTSFGRYFAASKHDLLSSPLPLETDQPMYEIRNLI